MVPISWICIDEPLVVERTSARAYFGATWQVHGSPKCQPQTTDSSVRLPPQPCAYRVSRWAHIPELCHLLLTSLRCHLLILVPTLRPPGTPLGPPPLLSASIRSYAAQLNRRCARQML